MNCASKFFTCVGIVLVAAATAVAPGAGVSYAQGMAGPAPVPGYAAGGADSQPYGSQAGGSHAGATGDESGAGVAVPMAGGGQVIVPAPHTQAPGPDVGSRGGLWSLERTNPNSLGGVPQAGP